MPQAVESATSALEQVSERVRALESRIAALESVILKGPTVSRPDARPSSGGDSSSRRATFTNPLPRSRFADFGSSANVFSTVGKSVLGFAGAFLLRALAESGSVPKLPVLIVAILYACFWVIWSARVSDRFASVSYALTSSLILSPMLWEATVRFQVMSPTVSATVLVLFIGMTLALASGHNLQLIPWVATLAAVSTAIALIIGTRELVPLTLALLAIAAATEITACLGHDLAFRIVPAVAADFSVWLCIYILGSENLPEGYRGASPATLIVVCALLPAIYAASIGWRSFARPGRITYFDIAQSAASFAVGGFGILTVSRNAAAPALGTVFLLLASVCYWGTLLRFAGEAHTRNRRVSASWAAALLLSGSFLLLPYNFQIPFLCLAALIAAVVYTRSGRASLGVHASFYLASAAGLSSLASYIWSSLAGTVPALPNWRAWAVAAAAALCYLVESRNEVDEGRRRLLWLVPSGIVAFTIAGWTVAAAVRMASGRIELAASHLSMIRTVVICVLALALGLASRRRHIELRWIAYAAVALGTLKLVLEDLRFGNPASLVVSFVFYGLILIVLPRLTRKASEASAGVPIS